MAILSVKIHPAIGIARVGNSPDDFFIGPERRWEHPSPSGGFKDAHCRVKRQAARFRIFAYNDDATVTELTAADADITWTAHLVNKKATMFNRNPGVPAADITIDPGSRTLNGPNQRAQFDTGTVQFPGAPLTTVPLGEIRTDTDGHLLVLGGFGKSASPAGLSLGPGWYDDVSDGPITATVTVHSTAATFTAVGGAWVIVGPPKFAPYFDNVITVYDRVFQMGVDQGWIAGGPAMPSYTDDVYPILQRARDTNWVLDLEAAAFAYGIPPSGGGHSWVDPVYDPAAARLSIFNRLKPPPGVPFPPGTWGTWTGTMPLLAPADLVSTRLTAMQYGIMQNWKDDNFTRDWVAPPTPSAQVTPAGMDRAALEACVGMPLYPGVEVGSDEGSLSFKPIIIDPTKFLGTADPGRLDQAAVSAGDLTARLALPWQADFWACGDRWWPVPRPNDVIPQGESAYQDWIRGVGSATEMVDEWHTLGFVVPQGSQYVEVDRCDTTFINLLTPHLNFQDVPQGPMGMSHQTALAIAFEVRSTGAAVTLEVLPGDQPSNLRLQLDSSSVTVGPTAGSDIATARLWLRYETGPLGEVLTDQTVVSNVASGRSWTVTITANTVGRKVAAAALVLDRSGSMSQDRGDGLSKHQSLTEAASIFVDVMLEGDGVGLIRYNEDAQLVQGITAMGAPGDATREDTKTLINGPDFSPSGATSIGDGIFEGRAALTGSGPGYDLKALVVMTDGVENRERWISDVAPQIDERTYAVGVGTPENTSAAALQNISGNHGGYLLVTGSITGDNSFILNKYFLQILAGISNAEIVLDPDGQLVPGYEQRIPFQLTESDNGVDVVLLAQEPREVDFRLLTPNGYVIEPWRALAQPEMQYVLSKGVSYYRVALPTELLPGRFDQAGTWHALLAIGKPRTSKPGNPDAAPTMRSGSSVGVAGARTLPYSLLVHSYSNLSLRASIAQSGYEPGARVTLDASLSDSGIPSSAGARAWAEILRPDGSAVRLDLGSDEPGRFAGSFATTIPGVYRCRVRAAGTSRAGHPFQREQTLTAAVWLGGDHDADPRNADGGPLGRSCLGRSGKLCMLLACLCAICRRRRVRGKPGDDV